MAQKVCSLSLAVTECGNCTCKRLAGERLIAGTVARQQQSAQVYYTRYGAYQFQMEQYVSRKCRSLSQIYENKKKICSAHVPKQNSFSLLKMVIQRGIFEETKNLFCNPPFLDNALKLSRNVFECLFDKSKRAKFMEDQTQLCPKLLTV